MGVTRLLPFTLLLVTELVLVHSAPSLNGTTPTHSGELAHARVLNLTPVYPMLDVTLGVLSYAAFAVYIVMLFGGYLMRANALQEGAAAINRQGEALLDENAAAASQDTIDPALLQLLLGANTAYAHRYHPSSLLTHMDFRHPSARLTHDAQGQSQYGGPASYYNDLAGINSYSDITQSDILTHERHRDRLGVLGLDILATGANSGTALPRYTNQGLKVSNTGVLSALRPTSSAEDVPGAGVYNTMGGGSGMPERVAPLLRVVAPSQRYPVQVSGRIAGQQSYQSWGQKPHWSVTSPSQYLKTPPTLLGGVSHLSDAAVTPRAIILPSSRRRSPHTPGLHHGQASQDVGAISQGQPSTGPPAVSTAPTRYPGFPTPGYSLLPSRLPAGLQTFAGVRRSTPASSVTLSLNTQSESPAGVGNLNISTPQDAGYTQGVGRLSEYARPLDGMWTTANRQPGPEGVDSLPLQPPTRYRFADGKLNTPSINHNQPDHETSNSDDKSKQGRVRPINDNTTSATDDSLLANEPSRPNSQLGVSTTEGMAIINSTLVTNTETQGKLGTSGHQTGNAKSGIPYAPTVPLYDHSDSLLR